MLRHTNESHDTVDSSSGLKENRRRLAILPPMYIHERMLYRQRENYDSGSELGTIERPALRCGGGDRRCGSGRLLSDRDRFDCNAGA